MAHVAEYDMRRVVPLPQVRGMQMDAVSSAEERKNLAGENEKLKLSLQAARQKASKALAADKAAKVDGEAKGREEAFTRQIRELTAMQKRLDLALNRANRERDTAIAESNEREEQLRNVQHQKKALQMQLHSLGGGKGTAKSDRSDMLCFYCEDQNSSQVGADGHAVTIALFACWLLGRRAWRRPATRPRVIMRGHVPLEGCQARDCSSQCSRPALAPQPPLYSPTWAYANALLYVARSRYSLSTRASHG